MLLAVFRPLSVVCLFYWASGLAGAAPSWAADPSVYRAGASVVDVSPPKFPVAVNGGMTARFADSINTPVFARAVVMAQGDVQAALVVVDSCMLPRPLLDETKAMAAGKTGIAADRIMISATHTHTAPAAASCLGTDADPEYQAFLRVQIVQAIAEAQSRLQPARVGYGQIDAKDYMAIRRWILRPDRIGLDPFGNPTVRATMHAGADWNNVTGPSGPEDPDLSMISWVAQDGTPIALMANLSMHYFSGPPAIDADYFGRFCELMQTEIAGQPAADAAQPFVAIMSHGCSGDIWRRDYTKQTDAKFDSIGIDDYTAGLAELCLQAYRQIEHQDVPRLAMAEQRLELDYRLPDAQLLKWSQDIVAEMGDRLPQTSEEIYAREQLYLHEAQKAEVVVQGISLGDIGIATFPTETYALTGLKVKTHSPFKHTMVIELANGGDGYIPPPEQHHLGGYNTWAARSAGLEVLAEPKLTEAAIVQLERVSGQPRQPYIPPSGPAAEAIATAGPLAYWRLDDQAGSRARDISGNGHHGSYEAGCVHYLYGPDPAGFSGDADTVNRCMHFAGGRMHAVLDEVPASYTVTMWIWNGLPTDARDVTGWFYSRGNDFGRPAGAEQLGLGGVAAHTGKLVLQVGDGELVGGHSEIPRWTWSQVKIVRQPQRIRVYLNDASEPEIDVEVAGLPPQWADQWFFGGSSDGTMSWEGRLDEIAVFAGER